MHPLRFHFSILDYNGYVRFPSAKLRMSFEIVFIFNDALFINESIIVGKSVLKLVTERGLVTNKEL